MVRRSSRLRGVPRKALTPGSYAADAKPAVRKRATATTSAAPEPQAAPAPRASRAKKPPVKRPSPSAKAKPIDENEDVTGAKLLRMETLPMDPSPGEGEVEGSPGCLDDGLPKLSRVHSSIMQDIAHLPKRQLARLAKMAGQIRKKDEFKKAARGSPKTAKGKKLAKSPVKTKRRRREAVLEPKPNLHNYQKDPFFESKENVPFISTPIQSKLIIRAVLTNNKSMLKKLLDDVKMVSNVCPQRSVHVKRDPIIYAMLGRQAELNDMLISNLQDPNPKRVQPLDCLLEAGGTGTFNFHMLGHVVRQITSVRGAKEGNAALTKDLPYDGSLEWRQRVKILVSENVDVGILGAAVARCAAGGGGGAETIKRQFALPEQIVNAVRYGHRKLAGHLLQQYAYPGAFNELHQQVLLNDKEDLKPFRSVSVKKKGTDNRSVTPLHCACINPNVKYLEALLAVEPDYGLPDDDNWRPVHYAAACETPDPLKFLLTKGVSLLDKDRRGNTPLHVACDARRSESVKVLLQACLKQDPAMGIFGAKNRNGFMPLHLAVMRGSLESVTLLLASGAEIDCISGAGVKKVSPLMLACQQGHLGLVEMLIAKGASPAKKDRLRRTPLIHAILNGMTSVVSYLLRTGVSPHAADNSGNTACHYAAAYGWYHCLKLLCEAKADLNASNAWSLSPLAVAYMKGHMGLADLLLTQPSIDINCRDDKGMSLVALTVSGALSSSTLDQLKYLVSEHSADCSLADSLNNNALHHLATATFNTNHKSQESEEVESPAALLLGVATLLLKKGCDPALVNEDGKTPLMVILSRSDLSPPLLSLALLLLEWGSPIIVPEPQLPPKAQENSLHDVAKNGAFLEQSVTVIGALVEKWALPVSQALKGVNSKGQTPFLAACLAYVDWVDSGSNPSPVFISSETKEQKVVRQRDNFLAFLKSLLSVESSILGDILTARNRKNRSDEEDEEEEDEYSDSEGSENGNEEDEENERMKKEEKEWDKETPMGNILHVLSRWNLDEKRQPKRFLQPLLKLIGEFLCGLEPKIRHTLLEAQDVAGMTPLYAAVTAKQSLVATALVNWQADVNFVWRGADEDLNTDKKGPKPKKTVLMAAIEAGLTDLALKIVTRPGTNVTAENDRGWTPLHFAAAQLANSQMAPIVAGLLQAGASVQAKDSRGRTPLHIAADADRGQADLTHELVELLLAAGADPASLDIRGRIPLHYAFVRIGGHKDTTSIDPVVITSLLLEKMPPEFVSTRDKFGRTPLHYAAQRGAVISVLTLQNHKADLNAVDEQRNTPLCLAALHGHSMAVLSLLQAGANVHVSLRQFGPTFDSLEEYWKKNRWRWLPKREAQPTWSERPITFEIVRNEWQGILHVILDGVGADPEARRRFYDAVVRSALQQRKYNLAHVFIKKAKDSLRFLGGHEDTLMQVLARAIRRGDDVSLVLRVAQALIDCGAGFDQHSPTRPHAALFAARALCMPLVELLARTHPEGWDYFRRLAPTADGHTLLTMLYWNIWDQDRWPEVEMAAQQILHQSHCPGLSVQCCFPIPADLTDCGANLEVREAGSDPPWAEVNGQVTRSAWCTPLIYAVAYGNLEAARFLLKEGADPNQPDSEGLPPLAYAIRQNRIHLARLLFDPDYVDVSPGPLTRDQSTAKSSNQATRRMFGRGKRLHGKQPRGDEPPESDEEEEENEESEASDQEEASSEDEADEVGEEEESPSDAESDVSGATIKMGAKVLSTASGSGAATTSLNMAKAAKLSLEDSQGRSLLFYLLKPLALGAWENVDMLQLLLSAGASLESRDTLARTPLDVALATGQERMAQAIQDISQVPQSARKSAVVVPFTGDGDLRPVPEAVSVSLLVNPHLDSQAFIQQHLADAAKKSASTPTDGHGPPLVKPVDHSGYAERGEVVLESKSGRHPYSVYLTKVDVQHGFYGQYSFYEMQLIQRRDSELYILFTHWGRIGSYPGQFQRTPFSNREEAVKEFGKIFRQKTRNHWDALVKGEFKPQVRKYRFVGVVKPKRGVSQLEGKVLEGLDIKLQYDVPSKLLPTVQELLRSLSNPKALRSNATRVRRYQSWGSFRDVAYAGSLGELAKSTLESGLELLAKIRTNVELLESLREESDPKSVLARYTEVSQTLMDLSNHFYSAIPLDGFGKSELPVIDRSYDLQTLEICLSNLLEVQQASRFVAGACWRQNQLNPLDYILSALGCSLTPLSPDSPESQLILHYIWNSAPPALAVSTVYKIGNAPGLQTAYEEVAGKYGNRLLLWHGTKAVNLISILHSGLIPAAVQALHTGHAFGRGIYTSDCFRKSQNYCEPSADGTRYALLCEVAAGTVKNVVDIEDALSVNNIGNGARKGSRDKSTRGPLPIGYHSVMAMGRHIPLANQNITLPTGAVMPLGELVSRPEEPGQWFRVEHNEYVVYTAAQVINRYLIAFKQ